MLPPLPSNLLTSNPQFAILYSHLTLSLLNPAGTIPPSRHEAQARANVTEELHAARIASAKIEICRKGLQNVMSEDMHEELQDLILLLCAPSSTLTTSSLPLPFPTPHSPTLPLPLSHLSALLSTNLQKLYTSLSPLLSPSPPTRLTTLAHSRTLLTTNITHLTTTAAALLDTHRAIAETGVQLLERVRFGAVSRAAVAEAKYWGAVAAGLRAKLEVWELEAWRKMEREDARVSRAMEKYADWLKEWRRALEDRQAAAREALQDYETVEGMEGIVKVCRELLEEKKAVAEMVSRLVR